MPATQEEDLIVARPEGLYCPPGDFYIDPWRPVARAVITHAHSDHARVGHAHYLAHTDSEGTLRTRLGHDINLQTLPYGEAIEHHGVRVSLHPAGHVLGSAQVRLEHGGRVWVASGDYKTEPDGTCAPFEPVPCDTFITESTFGLPIYRWPTQAVLFAEIDAWWRANAEAGRASVLFCYAFGKAQRILHGVDASIGPIVVHGAVEPLNAVYRAAGVALPPTLRVSDAGRGCRAAQAIAGARAAFGAGHAVDEALRQLRRRVRERMDAAARHTAAARRGPGLRHVRPCRLARPAASHCRHGRRARVRHAWQRAGDGAVADGGRTRCPRLQDRVRRRGRPGSSRVFRRRAREGADGAR
jgi:DNA ligase-associated putative exonuclease